MVWFGEFLRIGLDLADLRRVSESAIILLGTDASSTPYRSSSRSLSYTDRICSELFVEALLHNGDMTQKGDPAPATFIRKIVIFFN